MTCHYPAGLRLLDVEPPEVARPLEVAHARPAAPAPALVSTLDEIRPVRRPRTGCPACASVEWHACDVWHTREQVRAAVPAILAYAAELTRLVEWALASDTPHAAAAAEGEQHHVQR